MATTMEETRNSAVLSSDSQVLLTVSFEASGEGTSWKSMPAKHATLLHSLLLDNNGAAELLSPQAQTAVAALKCMWDAVGRKRKTGKEAETSMWKPTPIQLHSWSVLLNLHNSPPTTTANLIAIAPTGSGKTLAYGMGILASSPQKKGICAICLVPTRELARQVQKDLKIPAKALSRRGGADSSSSIQQQVVCVYGGEDRDDQIQSLKRANSCRVIVVATPGRLVDLLEDRSDLRKLCASSSVKCLVLDEADCLAQHADVCEQIDRIRRFLPDTLRTCLFSATVSRKWDAWVATPRVVIKVDSPSLDHDRKRTVGGGEAAAVDTPDDNRSRSAKKRKQGGEVEISVGVAQVPSHVTQILRVCRSAEEKTTQLVSTIATIRQAQAKRNPGLTIVFFARIKTLQSVLKILVAKKHTGCSEYHGQMNQTKRERALADFRSGKSSILFATDIAARGIHVKQLQFVINYDFPDSVEQYVHRCGRAGRMQKDGSRAKGTVYSFVTTEELPPAMAKRVVGLLQSSRSEVDPSLAALSASGS